MNKVANPALNSLGPVEVTRPLLLDCPVPRFVVRNTQSTVSLEDDRGQWLILLARPAYFTPACTSEFIALQHHDEKFQQQGCTLLGLLADSIYSHVAWVRNIREKFGIEIRLPIVQDISMTIPEGCQPGDAMVSVVPTKVAGANKAGSIPDISDWYCSTPRLAN